MRDMGRSSRLAARSITARTAVAFVPITSKLVMSAPSQWVKLMISAPAMPGNRYLVPPEKPATSWGKTGPHTSRWSYSSTSRFKATATSRLIRPPVSCSISRAGIVPRVVKVLGLSQRWLKMCRSPAFSSVTVRPMSFESWASVIGTWVPRATRKSRACARGAMASSSTSKNSGMGMVRVPSGIRTSTRLPSSGIRARASWTIDRTSSSGRKPDSRPRPITVPAVMGGSNSPRMTRARGLSSRVVSCLVVSQV
jgi:hypothetical protein